MSLTSVYIRIVFRTKAGVPALELDASEKLYRYIWGIVKKSGSALLRINGMEDHLHLLVRLSASISIAELVRDVKANSSRWLKASKAEFPLFSGWATEYAVFSCSEREKSAVFNYVKNQREHHKRVSFAEEVKALFEEYAEEIPYFLKS